MRSPKRSPPKELVIPAELENEINSIEKKLSVQYTKIPSSLLPYVKDSRPRGETLHNPIGNFHLNRVSEATRRTAIIESKILEFKRQQFNIACRSNVKNEIARVVHMMDDNNKKRIEQWKVKTAKSPFNTDYYSKEVERERRSNEVKSFKEHKHAVKTALRNMKGEPDYDICPQSVIPKVTSDVGVQMALHYRTLKSSQDEVEKEKKILRSLIKNELKLIEETFHDKIPISHRKQDVLL